MDRHTTTVIDEEPNELTLEKWNKIKESLPKVHRCSVCGESFAPFKMGEYHFCFGCSNKISKIVWGE